MAKKTIILSLLALMFGGATALGGEKLSGRPISSYAQGAGNVFDGDEATYYKSTEADYAWVGLDLGEPFIIDKVAWKPRSNNAKTELGMFQGANNSDFSDAIPIYLIPDNTLREGEVKCSRGFRYVRYVGPAGSYAQVSELEFYGVAGKGDSSRLWQITNLPTISINTVDGVIPYDKETYISSTFIIISEDGTRELCQSGTGIRERGNASREFPKKPWKIKFEKKQNVLDAPTKAKKWTLISNYSDKTLMRNMLAFDVAKKMGMEWVPYCTPVDVVLNGEYKGCYQLCDQVEVNEGRVDIDELKASDTEGEVLTGGYFVEIDGYAADEPVWFSTSHYYLPITVKSPDEDEVQEAHIKYISDYFATLEDKLKDTDPVNGYRSIFDNRSFIQHMLVNEVTGNTDTYWSTYMYKRRNDPKIYTGPVWDFDLGFNNDFRTYPVTPLSGDTYLWNAGRASAAGNMKYFAERVLLKDAGTAREILEVWKVARENGLNAEWLQNKVDEYAELLDESQELNFKRWQILKSKVHMNPFAMGSYKDECSVVRSYMKPQMDHLDKVIGYEPEDLTGISPVYDDSEPEYFTLSGLKVSAPLTEGIYIEIKGGKARKILVLSNQ